MLPSSHRFAMMEPWMLLFLLLILPSKPQGTGPRIIMHLKLQDSFPGNLSVASHFQEFLEKACHFLKLPLGTNITLLSPGSPHRVTC
ncbi:surfactant-associated protein 2-like [Sarcophilus harrisii]|uniref:surfactant-associated protein 2-like n=1 Tax=Sarcophilus harrisii TaxID=9305 RepID=UPI000226FB02|nr:surfactant-associated protein 2-like [Sarcophilus harrisii]